MSAGRRTQDAPTGQDLVVDLERRWATLAGRGGGGDAAVTTGAALVAAWRSPARRYHTLDHLAAVLDRIDELDAPGVGRAALDAGGRLEPSGAARVAAWYHDAVYEPAAPGNEEASAALAVADLGRLGWAPGATAEVSRLVLLTVDHRAEPGDVAGALLCDADLAVLGGDPASYARYVAAVRAEHPGVDAPGWRHGRAAVLRSLLDRDRLYVTVEGARRWEAAARRNLTAELADLTG